MNEKPRMIVASGTSDAMVSFLLKMSRQMKISTRSAQAMRTASSLATALPTSYTMCHTALLEPRHVDVP